MKQAYRGVDCTGDQERGTSGTPNDDTVHRIVDSLCIRADQYHTALFGAPEPETQFETPNAVFPLSLSSNISFYSPLQGVELRLLFPSLDNGTLVGQQLTFLVVNPYSGKVLEFRHHRPIQG
ncbi:hypothetical protein AVEN_145778-1 [Araneus ventricosus]|uniref:Uncharacterized protein n=1 Tax=Araneus ventricosus TaxID=182803 RepID=A0A4Y2AWI8_ARAVE|nr:hypothetical protein AVEN_248741-1 [Araneus ventricosus]GBL83936.1 hypothetical protein AVEN_54914-1 [Araneus ventricosus]GBL83981.1 hypothetical protein AVEN_145778-1 [Araneus ventricosus]